MSLADAIPPQFRSGAEAAAQALGQADNALITAHVNPDGDAIGAVFAAALLLAKNGKNFAIYLPGGIPANLSFLPVPGPVYSAINQLPFVPQWAIILDCSEQKRVDADLANYLPPNGQWQTINIDHHIAESGLGTAANFINHTGAATCQLMAYVALAMNAPLTGPLTESIGVGLITDTGNFSHCNTTAEVFELAALLERNGQRMCELKEKLDNSMTLHRLKLFGDLFLHAELADAGKLAYAIASQEEMDRWHCRNEDLEGFVEKLRQIRGVEIALLLKEREKGHCQFSLRSRGATDVQNIARSLGGGGHRNAAGGSLACGIHEARKLLLDSIHDYFLHQAPQLSR